jgi:hypothetical protein
VVLCTALATGACGGGGADASPPAATNPGPSVVGPTSAPGSQAAVGTFRACHKHRDGSLVLIFLFENRDRSLIGGFQGAVAFDVEAVAPGTWSDNDPVSVDPGENPHVRQITVPADQAPPSEVTLSVTTTAAVDATNELATNQVTIPVPASACSAA